MLNSITKKNYSLDFGEIEQDSYSKKQVALIYENDEPDKITGMMDYTKMAEVLSVLCGFMSLEAEN